MANTNKSSEEKTTKKKSTTNTKKETSKKETNKPVKEQKNTQKTKISTNKKEEQNKETSTMPKIEEKITVKKEEAEEKNTTKIVIIIALLIIFFGGIFYLSTLSGKGEYQEPQETENETSEYDNIDVSGESSSIQEEEKKDLTEIDIKKYLELKKNDETYSIIYIGRPTCSHCEIQKPIMEHLVYKYGVEINYLNTDNLDEDGFTELQSSDDFFKEGWGTPLTMVVKGDKLVDYAEGEASIEKLTDMFKKYGLINEGE